MTEVGRLLASGPLVRVAPFKPLEAALISTSLPGTKPTLLDKNRAALEERLSAIGSRLVFEQRTAHEAGALATAIASAKAKGADPILVFGASAITDRRDAIPAAIEKAGGHILHFGMPVDPGNLLLLAYKDDVPIVSAPGCFRSAKPNVVDMVLPPLLARYHVTGWEIACLGHGGLLV